MIVFLNKFQKTENMSFLIKAEKLQEKYESIWNRISSIIGKKLISNQFMVKLEFNNSKNNTNFVGKTPKKDSLCF